VILLSKYTPLINFKNISQHVGKKVSVPGRISNEPWQHMIANLTTHPFIYYFDDKDRDQIVIYAAEEIPNTEMITIWGSVMGIKGESKSPGSKEIFLEYHIVADKVKSDG